MMQQPVATTSAGSWMQQGNSFLNGALDAWVKVEQVKAAKSASGQDQVQRQVQPEIANGAGVQIDTTALDNSEKKSGFTVNEQILVPSVALLIAALLLKRIK